MRRMKPLSAHVRSRNGSRWWVGVDVNAPFFCSWLSRGRFRRRTNRLGIAGLEDPRGDGVDIYYGEYGIFLIQLHDRDNQRSHRPSIASHDSLIFPVKHLRGPYSVRVQARCLPALDRYRFLLEQNIRYSFATFLRDFWALRIRGADLYTW